MRFTQFGHHVPRKNSRISVPCASRPRRVNVPSRLAAAREKSGPRDPISRVSVRFCMLSSTLGEMEIRNNNGWGTGDDSILHLSLGSPAVYRRDPGAEFRRLYCFLKNSLCEPQSRQWLKPATKRGCLQRRTAAPPKTKLKIEYFITLFCC